MIDEELRYSERAVSWRPLWLVCGLLILGFVVDLALGSAHLLGWALAFVAIVGVLGISMYARAQFGSLSVSALRLRVGRESIPLSTVDLEYLRDSSSAGGPPVGARVVGGGWSVPKGRQALPVRLTDGAVVLVPCRDPAAVRTALLGEGV